VYTPVYTKNMKKNPILHRRNRPLTGESFQALPLLEIDIELADRFGPMALQMAKLAGGCGLSEEGRQAVLEIVDGLHPGTAAAAQLLVEWVGSSKEILPLPLEDQKEGYLNT